MLIPARLGRLTMADASSLGLLNAGLATAVIGRLQPER